MPGDIAGEEIRFGGGGLPMRARLDFELYTRLARVRRHLYGPTWFELMEQTFLQLTATPEGKQMYGDPQRGATLAQAARAFALPTGIPPVVLVAKSDRPVDTEGIESAVVLSRHELILLLRRCLLELDRPGAPEVFYFDGKLGHAISLFGAGDDGFTYHDPWPGRSLLAHGNNAAGISAQQVGQRWRVPTSDLERIIVAAFLFPSQLMLLRGEEYRTTYPELQATAFWKFFRVREINRRPGPGGSTIELATGGFRDHVGLTLTVDGHDRIEEAELRLDRRWVGDGTNPFAADIAKSFVAELTPRHDAPRVAPIVKALRSMKNPDQMLRDVHESAPQVAEFVATYAGLKADTDIPLRVSRLVIANRSDSDGDSVALRIDLY